MPAIISGIVFNDLDHNGVFNAGDSGIPNAFVVLRDTTGACINTQTDANGNYSFTNINVTGTYTIYETVATPDACPPTIFTQPTGFNESTTPRKITLTVTPTNISGNVTLSGNNFGHDDLAQFGCQSFAYQVQGSPTTLTRIDLKTGATVNVGTLNPSTTLFGTGYNPIDGNLWGMNNTGRVSRVTEDRTMTPLPQVPNLTNASNQNCGDVSSDGYLYLYSSSAAVFFVVDVNSNRSTYGKLVDPANSFQEQTTSPFGVAISTALNISDWSFNPQDGQLYAVGNGSGNVARINPITGAVTVLTTTPATPGTYGAAFFDNHNNLYEIDNNSGQVFRYAISGNTATRTLFSQSVAASTNDGARCATAPISFASFTSTKSATPLVGVGDDITYTIALNNIGNTTATNVILIDTMPNGTSFKSGTIKLDGNTVAGNPSPPSGVNLGSLSLGLHTITFVATAVSLPSPNPTPNTATTQFQFVDGTYPDIFTDTIDSNIASTTIAIAQLTSVKSVNNNFADVGTTITYTIVYTNTGNTTASNINFIDTIPNGTVFVASSLKQDSTNVSGSPNPPGVTLSNSIGVGKTSTITFSVTVTTIPNTNPIPNTAYAKFTYVGNPTIPTTKSGDSGSNIVNVQFNQANLGNIVKGVDKGYAKVGDILTYIITIPNSGNVTANNIIFKDTIPSGTSFIANSVIINGAVQNGFVVAPPTGTSLGSIAPGGLATLSFKVTVTTIPSPNPIPNSGNISYNYVVDPNLGTINSGSKNTNIVNTTINDAVINSAKKVTPINTTVGSVINYTIILSNSGNATANNVVFIDTIPDGTSFVTNSFAINGTTQTGANPSPPNGVNIPNIAPNGVATLTFKVTVDTIPTTNPIPNSSTTNYTFILNPTTGETLPSSSNSNTVTTFVNPNSNPLKIVDKQYAVPGDILTYTLQFENRLVVTATDVVLIDTIPNDTSFLANSVAVNGTTVTGATVSPPNGINIGTIPAGVFTTVTFKVTVTNTIPSTNPILNQAMGRYNYISDPTLGTITTETVVSNTVNTQINIASIPSATKAVDKVFAKVGDVLTYTLSFTNIGNTTATNVNLIDTIPNNTTFVINSVFVNGSNQPGAVVAPPTGLSVGSLGINATATVVFQITVNTVPNPNPIPNIGFVSYNYVIDPIALTNGNGSVNTNLVNTQVNYADFGIAGKTVSKTFSNIGDILTYTIVYTNTGNVTANNVIISDIIPNDTAFEASSVIINNTPNTTTVPVGNVLIISAGNVAPNGSATLSFKVKVTTIPNPNPIPNSANSSFTYTVDPALPNGVTSGNNTNIVNTQVNNASLGGITKFVDKAYATCGEIITYTISIPNSGNITATNVVLSDTVPNGTSFISNSILVNGSTVGGTPQSIALGSIAPGATTTVSYEVTVVC